MAKKDQPKKKSVQVAEGKPSAAKAKAAVKAEKKTPFHEGTHCRGH